MPIGRPYPGTLYQLADAVLDNGTTGGDAAVHVGDLDLGLGPTSDSGGREHNAELLERYRGRLQRVP